MLKERRTQVPRASNIPSLMAPKITASFLPPISVEP